MRTLLAILGLLIVSVPASAEPITYSMTGTVTRVDDGSGDTEDLTGIFAVGAPFSCLVTAESSTVPTLHNGVVYSYMNPILNFVFDIGSWQGIGVGGNTIVVINDQATTTGVDNFACMANDVSGPSFGSLTASYFSLWLADDDGNALSSGALPKPLPDASEWESTRFTLIVTDFSMSPPRSGQVNGTIGSLSTPAKNTTWGAVKDQYR